MVGKHNIKNPERVFNSIKQYMRNNPTEFYFGKEESDQVFERLGIEPRP